MPAIVDHYDVAEGGAEEDSNNGDNSEDDALEDIMLPDDEVDDPHAKKQITKALKIIEAQEDPDFHNPAPPPIAPCGTSGAQSSNGAASSGDGPETRPIVTRMPYIDDLLFARTLVSTPWSIIYSSTPRPHPIQRSRGLFRR